MKNMYAILKKVFVLVLVMVLAAGPVMAIPADNKPKVENSQKSKAQIEREKAAEKKAKEKAKAAEKKAKEKAKAAKKKQKEADKKAKDQAKAADQKAKEVEKRTEDKAKELERREAEQARATAIREEEQAKKSKKLTQMERRMFNQDIHFVDFWGGLGYSGMVNNYATGTSDLYTGKFDSKFLGGGGGFLGIGYELRHKHFLLKVGPEFRLLTSVDQFKMSEPLHLTHQDYSSMVQYYNFDPFHETQIVGQVMLPVMMGGNFDKFYFLAGAKVGYTIMGLWNQAGTLTTSVNESMAVEEWGNMPTHYLVQSPLAEHPLYGGEAKGKNPFGFDVTLSAEFGINLNDFFSAEWLEANADKEHPWHFRLGAFIDYGIPNMNICQNVPFFSAKQTTLADGTLWENPTAIGTTSIHQSDWATSRVNSLLVGIKFTAMLQMNKPKIPNPRMQMWVEDAFTSRGIGSAQVNVLPEGKKRAQVRTMKKDGGYQQRYAKGNYTLWANANGYLPSDTLDYTHEGDLQDTIRFRLIPKPKWAGWVHDSKTEKLVVATFTFTDEATGETSQLMSTLESAAQFSFPLGHTYRVNIQAEGYHGRDARVADLYATDHYYLDPVIRVRRVLILKHMYFATDKTDILPMSENDLMTLYNFLTENPKIRVLITGHTDSQGTDAYNQKLSEGRAASVKAEMVKRGIDASRLETDGKGESEPIDTNETDEGRQNNRRVEVTVLNAEDAVEDVY